MRATGLRARSIVSRRRPASAGDCRARHSKSVPTTSPSAAAVAGNARRTRRCATTTTRGPGRAKRATRNALVMHLFSRIRRSMCMIGQQAHDSDPCFLPTDGECYFGTGLKECVKQGVQWDGCPAGKMRCKSDKRRCAASVAECQDKTGCPSGCHLSQLARASDVRARFHAACMRNLKPAPKRESACAAHCTLTRVTQECKCAA